MNTPITDQWLADVTQQKDEEIKYLNKTIKELASRYKPGQKPRACDAPKSLLNNSHKLGKSLIRRSQFRNVKDEFVYHRDCRDLGKACDLEKVYLKILENRLRALSIKVDDDNMDHEDDDVDDEPDRDPDEKGEEDEKGFDETKIVARHIVKKCFDVYYDIFKDDFKVLAKNEDVRHIMFNLSKRDFKIVLTEAVKAMIIFLKTPSDDESARDEALEAVNDAIDKLQSVACGIFVSSSVNYIDGVNDDIEQIVMQYVEKFL